MRNTSRMRQPASMQCTPKILTASWSCGQERNYAKTTPFWFRVNTQFQSEKCVPCMVFNIPIKFEDDWFNNNEMAANFRNSRWRRLLFRFWVNTQFQSKIVFLVWFSTYPSNLKTIGSIQTKWQPIFGNQDGGVRHFEFKWRRTFNSEVVFLVWFPTYPSNLKTIGSILTKWQPIFDFG